jgi:hypothetical protein
MTMTVSLRILLAMAGLMALLHSAYARDADADDDKRYGKCVAGAEHAAVPAIKGLMYDKARKKLLASGWMPHVLRNKDGGKNQENGVMELGAGQKYIGASVIRKLTIVQEAGVRFAFSISLMNSAIGYELLPKEKSGPNARFSASSIM